MATTRTKAVAALAVIDIVRQASHAWSARQQAERERSQARLRVWSDARRLAREARVRAEALARGIAPSTARPSLGDRLRTWLPVLLVMAASTAAVVLAARVIARQEGTDADTLVTDSRMVGAARASSRAIDASVAKVASGGSAVAAGAAASAEAASAAVRQAAVRHAKDQVDERVVQPARRKVTRYGALGLVALTVYVIAIAAVVQLAVDAVA